MFRLAVRNFSRRKFRSAVVILAIAMSVSIFVALDITTKAAMLSVMEAYTDYLGDFDILIYKNNFELFNLSKTSEILRKFDEIDAISYRLIFGGLLLNPYVNSKMHVVVVGINLSSEADIGKFELVDGDMDIGANNCIILDTVAKNLDVSAGSNVVLWYNDLNGSSRSIGLHVSGVVEQYGKLPSDITNAIFIEIETAWSLLNISYVSNIIFIKLKGYVVDPLKPDKSIDNIVQICKDMQKELGFDYVVQPIKAHVLRMASESILFQKTLLSAFASITTIMAIVLVIMISLMNIHDRIREIGILRSIGLPKIRVFFLFIVEYAIIGFIGGLFGVIMSLVVYDILSKILIPRPLRSYVIGHIPYGAENMIIGVLSGMTISILGGIYPSIRASLISPIEALQPSARRIKYLENIEKKISPEASNKGVLLFGFGIFSTATMVLIGLPYISVIGNIELVFFLLFLFLLILIISIIMMFTGVFSKLIRLLSLIVAPMSSAIRWIACGNIIRYKHRAIALFFMLSLSVASLFTVGFVTRTQMKSIEMSMEVNSGAPIVIYAREPLPENITALIEEIDGIKAYCPVTYPLSLKAGDMIYWKCATVNIYGIDPGKYVDSTYAGDFEINKEVLQKLEDNRTAIISSGLAEYLNLKIGDSLRIEYMRVTFLLKIVGILPLAVGFSFTRFSSKVASGTDIIVSLNTFKNITGYITFSRIFIKPEKGENSENLIEKIHDALGEEYDIQVVSIDDYIERSKEALESLENILSILLFFAILVAILGETLSVLMTIRERLWEIGVMRAIGSSKTKISSMFSVEVAIIAFSSYLVGLMASYIVASEINFIVNFMSEIQILVVIPWSLLIVTLIVVIVPSAFLAFVGVYVYSRKNIADIIRRAERV